jgi:CubicO group peptidase (beta-lactamase class C family)
MEKILINGEVEKGFEKVRNEFELNFKQRGELGAACTVFHKGQKVVDLWGGYRDKKKLYPWQENTLVHVFSTTKGFAALTFAVANSQGLFEFNEKVATYWPEFAQNGKENITIGQLMSFQSGLCYINQKLDAKTIADLDELARIISKQKPVWNPGDYHGYHLFTADWCASEIIRRTDSKHRSLGQFLQDEIAKPLELELYIGTPQSISNDRFAEIIDFNPLEMLLHMNTMPFGMVVNLFIPGSLTSKVLVNVNFKKPSDMGLPPYRNLELPGGNGIGLVRSMAKLYSVFATGGQELKLKKETLRLLTNPASIPKLGTKDKILKRKMVYSYGLLKPFPGFIFSPSALAFGAAGTGGSNAFADPEAQIGFAYAPNRLGFASFNDPREKALRDSLYACI